MIAVLLPELVEHHWLHYFLHNQRPEMIAIRLMRTGKERIMIVNVPWYLPDCARGASRCKTLFGRRRESSNRTKLPSGLSHGRSGALN